jgi:hypothetical protein
LKGWIEWKAGLEKLKNVHEFDTSQSPTGRLKPLGGLQSGIWLRIEAEITNVQEMMRESLAFARTFRAWWAMASLYIQIFNGLIERQSHNFQPDRRSENRPIRYFLQDPSLFR